MISFKSRYDRLVEADNAQVDDMVEANPILFKTAAQLTQETGQVVKKGEHPDHIVVIKHVPAVGDSSKSASSWSDPSKLMDIAERAIDEYYSELLMGGRNVMVCLPRPSESRFSQGKHHHHHPQSELWLWAR